MNEHTSPLKVGASVSQDCMLLGISHLTPHSHLSPPTSHLPPHNSRLATHDSQEPMQLCNSKPEASFVIDKYWNTDLGADSMVMRSALPNLGSVSHTIIPRVKTY